jgi:hypothetical protein
MAHLVFGGGKAADEGAFRRWLMDRGNGPKGKLPRWVTRRVEPCGSTGQTGGRVTNRPCFPLGLVSSLLGAGAPGIIATPANWLVTSSVPATANRQPLRLSVVARGDQAGFVGEDHELGPVAGVEFGHGPVDVGFRRHRADHHVGGDLVV